jgi:hypothetical protein
MYIVTCNSVDPIHLAKVQEEMLTLGAPRVRAVYDGEVYWAVEGTHRLAAAHALGLLPEIEVIEYNDDVISVQVDGYDEDVVVSEWADMLMANRDNKVFSFEEE